MKKLSRLTIFSSSALILIIFLAGCGNSTTPTKAPSVGVPTIATVLIPTITMTPNPCAPENIQAEVNKVHKHMREFDDASILAANVTQDKLSDAIANLQRIRRDAEDQTIPSCLAKLKTYQIAHMNTVIQTLIAFMNNSDKNSIDQGIAVARQQHDQYTIELAKVLGLPIVTATAPAANSTAQSPTP